MPLDFDYEFVVGDSFVLLDLFATLREAVDERIDASFFPSDRVLSRLPNAGDYALAFIPGFAPGDGGASTGGWAPAQSALYGVSQLYVRALPLAGGAEYTNPRDYTTFTSPFVNPRFAGLSPVSESAFPPPEVTVEVPDWPWPVGFTRKHPREIRSLADDGELGWVARLSASADTSVTPLAERVHSGKLFKRQLVVISPPGLLPEVKAPGWVEETQAKGPDVVTEFGLIQAGDYAGVWIPNEMRDAARRLRWTFSPIEWTAPATEVIETSSSGTAGSNLFYAAGTPGWDTVWGTLLNNVDSRWGTDAAEDLYLGTIDLAGDVYGSFRAATNSTADNPAGVSPGNPQAVSSISDYVISVNINDGRLGRALFSKHSYPKIDPLPLWDRTKKIQWVVAGAFAAPGDTLNVYDDFGHGFLENVPSAFAQEDHQGKDALGPRMGNAAQRPPLDTPGLFSKGYVGYCGAVVKWNVEGGFKHT